MRERIVDAMMHCAAWPGALAGFAARPETAYRDPVPCRARLHTLSPPFWVVSEWRRSSASTVMSKGLKVAFDRDDTASGISSCSSTEMTEPQLLQPQPRSRRFLRSSCAVLSPNSSPTLTLGALRARAVRGGLRGPRGGGRGHAPNPNPSPSPNPNPNPNPNPYPARADNRVRVRRQGRDGRRVRAGERGARAAARVSRCRGHCGSKRTVVVLLLSWPPPYEYVPWVRGQRNGFGLRSFLGLRPLCGRGGLGLLSPHVRPEVATTSQPRVAASHVAALPNHAGDPEPELHQKTLMVPPACARAQLPNP
eukprot:scaffold26527_cov69-Phaeocystis_antarctica.AAC.5